MKSNIVITVVLLSLLVVTCKHKLPEPKTNTTTTTGTTTTTTGSTTGGSTTGTTVVVPPNPKDSVCYEQEIAPILNSNCASQEGCHNAIDKKDGIDLSSYNSLTLTVSGPTLLKSINETDIKKRMPLYPNPALKASQIALIKQWVDQGMKIGVDCKAPCDTASITYSGTIKKILENDCFGCHQTFSPVFTNYDQLKSQLDNGKFECSINHGNGCFAMPKNTAKLDDCKIKQISIWLKAGYPNN